MKRNGRERRSVLNRCVIFNTDADSLSWPPRPIDDAERGIAPLDRAVLLHGFEGGLQGSAETIDDVCGSPQRGCGEPARGGSVAPGAVCRAVGSAGRPSLFARDPAEGAKAEGSVRVTVRTRVESSLRRRMLPG